MRVLRQPRVAAYYLVHTWAQIGTWVQQVVVGWFAWEQTHSEVLLGFLIFVQFAPSFVISPLAGILADRGKVMQVVVISDAICGLTSLGMAALAFTGNLTTLALIGCALLVGICGSFSQPARQVLLTRLVEKSEIASAVSVNSVSMNIARSVGPLGAAYLITNDLSYFAFALSGVAALADAMFVRAFFRKGAGTVPIAPLRRESLIVTLKGAFTVVLDDPSMRLVFLVYLAYALLGRPVIDMLPAIVDSILRQDARVLGNINALFGVLAIAAGLLLSLVSHARALLKVLVASLVFLAAGTAMLSLSSSELGGYFAIGIFALGQAAVNICSSAFAQMQAVETHKGRVVALHVMTFRAGAAVGGLLVGYVAGLMGLANVMIAIAACLCVVFACAIGSAMRFRG
ncbi:MFS transporter [Cupriavidus oxalaticus]|uniref:MFS transporter n=1 Tax=Cupriavidus oxalaticus TaxID=96344 RepID=A0A375GDP0_9BURK|nr:MFS transporter [Cupriavidus oxalaticus]QEZ44357.1 MFS transporter [Cupriavidus oxalaticus]QRQ84277.1 MFS transporter [Cupriavidus oxalaticus]QRQ91637.1 MFS transporter [Cupriavidus oxalaticus]WQD86214.1 MFS transporter [Cupriavidus oxalaticus]SPC05130.1 putative MFS transporter [Cupriavidus oxalaticus]